MRGCFEFVDTDGIKILLGRRDVVTGPQDRSFEKCQFSPKGMHNTGSVMHIAYMHVIA
jgi:hypothetical protein